MIMGVPTELQFMNRVSAYLTSQKVIPPPGDSPPKMSGDFDEIFGVTYSVNLADHHPLEVIYWSVERPETGTSYDGAEILDRLHKTGHLPEGGPIVGSIGLTSRGPTAGMLRLLLI